MPFNLPTVDNALSEKLRKDLRSSGTLNKLIQLLVGVIFAICEGIIINLATSARGTEQIHLWWILVGVAVIHLILFGCALSATTPLPQFLLEFDALTQALKQSDAQVTAYQWFTETYNASVIAVQISLSAIEARRLEPRSKIEIVLEEALSPWVAGRSQIFNFTDGDALYNFAVYEYFDAPRKLKIIWRSHDNRLKVQNREWEPGFGHIGVCYQQGKTIFSDDVSASGDDNPIVTDNPEDRKNYRSMVSTPIIVDGNKKGVLIVTSSKPNQFDKELHSRIVEVVAILSGQAIKHCWTKSR